MTSTDFRLSTLLDERRTRLRQLDPEGFEALAASPIGPHLDRLLAASDYAFEQLCKRPALMARLSDDEPAPALGGLDEAAAMATLRRYRHAESLRQIARDVAGVDAVQDTVRASAVLADRCCQLALDYAMATLVARHGQPRSREGALQQLVVFGLGKQGGSELNFSSDIDLVFAYPEGGETDGARALDNESFFVRLGQLLIRLLGEVTVDGFVYRVSANVGQGGQYVKEGDELCTIVPDTSDRVVELFLDGIDAPLVLAYADQKRELPHVRLQFEGWPAIQFSGWPELAIGTFGGKVRQVDAAASDLGKFRVLVEPEARLTGDVWPDQQFLRQGNQAVGWVLLNRVPLGYEIWRRLNGFPPVLAPAGKGKDLDKDKGSKPPKIKV